MDRKNGIILAIAALLAGLALVILRWVEDERAEDSPAGWAGNQASRVVVDQRVAAGRQPAPQERSQPEAAPRPAEVDDLRRIEGIGPKTDSVLHEANITSFRQLAETSVNELEQILGDAGMPPMVSPATWPEQAALAAKGEWEKLAALQDTLRAGRRRS